MSVGGHSKAWQPLAPRIRTEPITGGRVGRCTTFEYVAGSNGLGPPEEIVVPQGVREARIEVWGASGGNGSLPGHNNQGGLGGFVAITYPVHGGMVLRVFVGQGGEASFGSTTRKYNGGGAGGPYSADGSAGGGATDVRISPFDLGQRIVVAGGGGGGGAWSGVGINGAGGDGGYPDGVAGANHTTGGTGGGGGTQTAGGAAGAVGGATTVPQDGTQGQGGNGGGISGGLGLGAGGGGGGWYGGGGGGINAGGGGGGSSGFLPAATLLDHRTGVWFGNGQARICWV